MSAPATLSMGGGTPVLVRGQAGWEPRQVDERRMLYRPKWDIQQVAIGQQQEIQFFTNRSGNRWVTNSNQAGTVNVYESFMVSRLLFVPLFGTSEADMIELLNNCIFEFNIQNDRAYELLLEFAQPGVGLAGNTSTATHGTPITGYAQDLGNVIVGGGVDFNITLKFPNGRLNNQNAIDLRCQLEAMADIAVG